MTKTIKYVVVALAAVFLTNCGSDGGGGGGGAPVSNAAVDAAEMEILFSNGDSITWENSLDDIYINDDTPGCRYGLSQGADDRTVQDKVSELASLINSSTVGLGTNDRADSDSRYLIITYNDGKTRRFNLDNSMAGSKEETLSKNLEILSFLEELEELIEDQSIRTCGYGKGDK